MRHEHDQHAVAQVGYEARAVGGQIEQPASASGVNSELGPLHWCSLCAWRIARARFPQQS
jgi:hypothetical protein